MAQVFTLPAHTCVREPRQIHWMSRPRTPEPADVISERWKAWCGENAWTATMDAFAILGGTVVDWDGVPMSKSAIPLTFVLYLPDGTRVPNQHSRLKDIKAAVAMAQDTGRLL